MPPLIYFCGPEEQFTSCFISTAPKMFAFLHFAFWYFLRPNRGTPYYINEWYWLIDYIYNIGRTPHTFFCTVQNAKMQNWCYSLLFNTLHLFMWMDSFAFCSKMSTLSCVFTPYWRSPKHTKSGKYSTGYRSENTFLISTVSFFPFGYRLKLTFGIRE